MVNNLTGKVGNAIKWSSITEICTKLVSLISNMALARLLAPEAFGVVATINVIISFTDMFTDAGFQKYLIQHEFVSSEDREESTTVAFWTNLSISLVIWGIIIVFRDQIAAFVGNPDKSNVLALACIVLPMTSFSSIQMTLFKHDFNFKSLFYTRIVGVCIPLLVTIPLAFIVQSYWALVIGNVAKAFSDAVVLTVRSKWKPHLFYSFTKLKEMFAFSMWTLFEQTSIWLTSYIGTFIVGIYLTSYYVGLYKTAISTVTQITSLITSALTPVLFSALSRVRGDKIQFEKIFLRFQELMSLLIVQMSIGVFLYRDFITLVLLGNQWTEAAMFVGLWGLTSSLGILLNNFCSEAYRALGRPRVSLLAQVLHLVVLIPALLVSAKIGFEALYWTRALIRFQMYITQLIILYVITKISFGKIMKNIYPSLVAGILMGGIALLLQKVSDGIIWSFMSILICVICYGLFL